MKYLKGQFVKIFLSQSMLIFSFLFQTIAFSEELNTPQCNSILNASYLTINPYLEIWYKKSSLEGTKTYLEASYMNFPISGTSMNIEDNFGYIMKVYDDLYANTLRDAKAILSDRSNFDVLLSTIDSKTKGMRDQSAKTAIAEDKLIKLLSASKSAAVSTSALLTKFNEKFIEQKCFPYLGDTPEILAKKMQEASEAIDLYLVFISSSQKLRDDTIYSIREFAFAQASAKDKNQDKELLLSLQKKFLNQKKIESIGVDVEIWRARELMTGKIGKDYYTYLQYTSPRRTLLSYKKALNSKTLELNAIDGFLDQKKIVLDRINQISSIVDRELTKIETKGWVDLYTQQKFQVEEYKKVTLAQDSGCRLAIQTFQSKTSSTLLSDYEKFTSTELLFSSLVDLCEAQ